MLFSVDLQSSYIKETQLQGNPSMTRLRSQSNALGNFEYKADMEHKNNNEPDKLFESAPTTQRSAADGLVVMREYHSNSVTIDTQIDLIKTELETDYNENELNEKLHDMIGTDPKVAYLDYDVSHWTCDDVLNWISSLELDRYSQQFENRQINGKMLLRMHLSDLQSIIVPTANSRSDLEFAHTQLIKLRNAVKFIYIYVIL